MSKAIDRALPPVVRNVEELIDVLRGVPPTASIVSGCMPGQDFVEVSYDAQFDIVRIVGPCDGEEPSL